MEDKEKCPYCGNDEFVLGKQEGYGAVVKSYVDNPHVLVTKGK